MLLLAPPSNKCPNQQGVPLPGTRPSKWKRWLDLCSSGADLRARHGDNHEHSIWQQSMETHRRLNAWLRLQDTARGVGRRRCGPGPALGAGASRRRGGPFTKHRYLNNTSTDHSTKGSFRIPDLLRSLRPSPTTRRQQAKVGFPTQRAWGGWCGKSSRNPMPCAARRNVARSGSGRRSGRAPTARE